MIYIVDPLPRDPDLNVRRVALVAFNSAAHNKPSLIRDLLREVLPQVPENYKCKGLNLFYPKPFPAI